MAYFLEYICDQIPNGHNASNFLNDIPTIKIVYTPQQIEVINC